MGVASPKRKHDLEFVAECQDEANASLIAASPELLDACLFALECTNGGDFTMNGPHGLRRVFIGDILKTAIAKAKGQP